MFLPLPVEQGTAGR